MYKRKRDTYESDPLRWAQFKNKEDIKDRIMGLFNGLILGDASGAPYEKSRLKSFGDIYDDDMNIITKIPTRYQGVKQFSAGQPTDDTEMTISLLQSIIDNNGNYKQSYTTKSYIDWAQTTWAIGKNTRELFKKRKTVKGYNIQYQLILDQKEEERSQSNGCLMRCSPLSLLTNFKVFSEMDCAISNPNKTCKDSCLIHVTALNLALSGISKDEIWDNVKKISKIKEIQDVFKDIEENRRRDVKTKKGWVLHSLYFSLSMLKKEFLTFNDALKWIIRDHPGSDTDTNACIAGSLLGAMIGAENFDEKSKKNLSKIKSLNPQEYLFPRPSKYSHERLFSLIDKLPF
jgi:ADP-ribosyl-[dinitrogen reductase] hydrolase